MPPGEFADPTAVVVSDVHFGAAPEAHERSFLRFLEEIPGRAGALVVAGDLFDFWFEYRSVVPKRPFPVLRRLARLVDAGVQVTMVGGNHDAWGGPFLREEVGVRWLEAPAVARVGGRRALVGHGDGLAGDRWTYRLMKPLLRAGPAVAAFRLLHPDLAARLVSAVSKTGDREGRGPSPEDRRRAEALAAHASDLLDRRRDLDLVVFGHTHVPTVTEIGPDRHYLNPGDWIHHRSYGLVTPETVELRRWESDQGAGNGTS